MQAILRNTMVPAALRIDARGMRGATFCPHFIIIIYSFFSLASFLSLSFCVGIYVYCGQPEMINIEQEQIHRHFTISARFM